MRCVLASASTGLFLVANHTAHARFPEINKPALTTTPQTDLQLAQAPLNDIASSWAEPFIQVLASQNIIAGYPDGSFRPDQPVTRAEFAALLSKAFTLEPTRTSRAFSDVPRAFWGAKAIDRAYRSGFMAGYPNNTFAPNQNIMRIESLVALTNGSKLSADTRSIRLEELFADADQVPNFGRDALLTATQKCVTVSNTYPTGKLFNPNGVATRADVAAFVHQTLVATGRLPAITTDSPVQKYIVNCGAIASINEADLLNATSVGIVPPYSTVVGRTPVNAPVGGITTPSAFGANWGDVFAGVGHSTVTGSAPNSDTEYGVGFGLGDARQLVGLETSYTVGGESFAERGGINFKLHKLVTDNVSIAVGVDNAFRHGYTDENDPKETIYGVLTTVLPIGNQSNITASVGAGNGRFRTNPDFLEQIDKVNFFGSLGLRVSENIAVAADYDGRNINIGLPLTLNLSDNVGIQVTPSFLNIGQATGSSSRFAISGGLGLHF